jgi:hypothetical protein
MTLGRVSFNWWKFHVRGKDLHLQKARIATMEMDIDKSDDELELERLVFGDSEGIKERLEGKKHGEQSAAQTNLEDLEDDQV